MNHGMIGSSHALSTALAHLSHVAAVNRPILILGERGTGKELAAERIHYLSPRWQSTLVKINCAALADSLLESELFGHEAGAFTGANKKHIGRFERAHGGTLFLDELGTMSMRLQEKILRVIEYGEFERLGGTQTQQVDVRVIAATNSDLKALAAQGKFLWDLLDRLSFDVVALPALRDRPEDIEELAQHFALRFCTEMGWELFPGFSAKALAQLTNHDWPGNIRELKSAVERSLYRWAQPNTPIGEMIIDPFKATITADREVAGQDRHSIDSDSSKRLHEIEAQADAATNIATPTLPIDLNAWLTECEYNLLTAALEQSGKQQKQAAHCLGLSYDQLRGLMRKHGIRTRKARSKI
jgi:psp operon transcriptional activator